MNERNWLELISLQTQLSKVFETNQFTKNYGLSLTAEDAELVLAERNHALQEEQRIEFGAAILPEIIYEFCDSAYIRQANYVETLIGLQRMFYLFKNEMLDEISDSELLHFMKEQFETICYGDLEYLEGTCLPIFAQAIRAGYSGYHNTDGLSQYTQFDSVPRWDKELYLEALRELCWR